MQISFSDNTLTTAGYVKTIGQQTLDSVDKFKNELIAKIDTMMIDGNQIKNRAINTQHIAIGGVTDINLFVSKIDYQNNGITNNYMPINANDSTLTTKGYVDAQYEILDNKIISIASDTIENYSIKEIKLANNSVSTRTLENNSVTRSKILDISIDSSKIDVNSIDSVHIRPNAIRSIHIKDSSVTNSKIQDGAVDSSKIAASSIREVHIANSSVTNSKIRDYSITDNKLNISNQIEYQSNNTADNMPISFSDNTLTTAGYVKTIGQQTLDSIDKFKNELITKIDTMMIDGNQIGIRVINNQHIAFGGVKEENIAVSKIDYIEHDANKYYTPDNAADSTLTTKKYVDVKVANIEDNIINKGILSTTNIKYYNNTADYMPDNATDSTLTTKKYVDTKYDTLKNRIDDFNIDEIDGEIIINGTINGNKIASGAITDSKMNVTQIDYQNNLPDNQFMPSALDVTGATLTTKGYVDSLYNNISITSDNIDDKAIKEQHIDDKAVKVWHIEDRAIMDWHISVGKIDYQNNGTTNNYMPANANDSTLTTKKYVDVKVADIIDNGFTIEDNSIEEVKLANNSVSNRTIINNAITTAKINDGAITTAKIDDGAITDNKLNVSKIEYNNVSIDAMPTTITDATLTTKGYVDNAIKNVGSEEDDEQPAVTLNSGLTALQIATGNIVLSYIDVEISNAGTTDTDLSEDYGNVSIINIYGNVTVYNSKVILPQVGVQPGHILYISNSITYGANTPTLETYNLTEIISNGSIFTNEAATFIAIKSSPTEIKWIKIK
jgi:hypothetical protein